MNLAELFNYDPSCGCIDPIEQAISDGYIRRQVHPTLPLAILNYTEKAAYESAWTPVTLTCRGIIYDVNTGEIVARPFAKFFNYGQVGCPALDLDAPAEVLDKVDGSLAVLYPTSDGYSIATRGSFTSDQALHATEIYRDRYAAEFEPPDGWTVLAEIVYPANRIVCDYGDLDDLVLLGAVEIKTGLTVGAYDPVLADWPGPRTAGFPHRSLAEALAMEPRPGAEGVVVRMLDTGQMVKIKQEEYVRLHRIVTGLTARGVWRHLCEGKPLADLIAPLPDEFHPWVREIANGIAAQVQQRGIDITNTYNDVVAHMPDPWDPASREGRKTFAAAVANLPDRWAMFKMLDCSHGGVHRELMRRADPGPCITPSGRTYGEDTA
jgi:RNA ligase